MNAFIEGYGCSLNKAETEMLKGFLLQNNFKLSALEKADLVVINTCTVKEQTETRMLRRIKELSALSKRFGFKLAVFGCLPKTSLAEIRKAAPNAECFGPNLEELASFLRLKPAHFSPSSEQARFNEFVSIIPICTGCLGSCTYCSTRLARGKLKSYPLKEITNGFSNALKQTKEAWLTAQDLACYGKDSGTSLPALLKELLKEKGNFRIRLGMMSPEHLKPILPQMLALFQDTRLYRFLHIPVQSGSDRILSLMNRHYTVQEFKEIVSTIRSKFPDMSISTDIIVGFPTESPEDFEQTLSLLRETSPDIVNISRFGARPNTAAAGMQQLHGRIKKERSRQLSGLCRSFSLERNSLMVRCIEEIFVSEPAPKGGFAGRTHNYKQVIFKKDLRGSFVKAKILKAFPQHLEAKILEAFQ